MEEAYLGVDIGSISTKGVIIDKNYKILASEYIWTEGDPMGAARKLIELLEKQFDKEKYQIVATGTTGSARKLVGAAILCDTQAFLAGYLGSAVRILQSRCCLCSRLLRYRRRFLRCGSIVKSCF